MRCHARVVVPVDRLQAGLVGLRSTHGCPHRCRVSRRSRLNLSLAGTAFLVTAVVAIIAVREPMEPLTRPALAAAIERWRVSGLTSYDLSFRMNGNVYEVAVRDGVVTSAKLDGRPPTTADVRAYTVDGLFDTLGLELANRDDPTGPFAGAKGGIIMRVRFNAERGYLERYLRSSGGQGRGASIELIGFVPLP